MRVHSSRRAVRLASTLVAAGLMLTAAPHALAADGSSDVMRLTSAQATKLAQQMGVDVYGDDTAAVDPDGTAAAEKGSKSAAPAAGASVQDLVTTPVTFTNKATLEGVNGLGATVPAGASGNYFTVHSLGNIQLHKADGTTVWERGNTSYFTDWQAKPVQPWRVEPYPVRIVTGYNAVSPTTPNSDQGYDTGDLTGDGVPDLVFSGFTGTLRAITSPGSSLTSGTFVTVLDGRTGKTVWSKMYSYASMVKVVDGTLLIGNSPRLNSVAPADETVTLTGIRFSEADGKLTPVSTWTHDTGESGSAAWGAIADLGDGKVAAVWDRDKTATAAGRGRTLVLDTADGAVEWQTDSALYGRQLRVDASRNRLVAVEQSDVREAVRYEVVGYDLDSGRRTAFDSRDNALPTALTVGDAAGGGGDEYAVAESTFTDSGYVNANTIRVLDGDDPSGVKWTYTQKRDAGNLGYGPSVWALDVAGGKLLASGQDDRDSEVADNYADTRYGSLTAFTGKGKISWQHRGATASPMFQEVHGSDYVRVVDTEQNVREYQLGNGKEKHLTPLRGNLNYARATDLDGDKKPDLVAGGASHGVWAYSGASLLNGEPKKLWQATAPGGVHGVETGDVTGDGKPEIVVAADSATVVLNGKTGKVLTTIDGGGQYVRSVTLADVDGDGKDEILVPTDALRVYRGDGTPLWTYAAPASAGPVYFSDPSFADGQVYTQYASAGSLRSDAPVQNGVALAGATGALKWTADPKAPAESVDGKLRGVVLSHGVFASPKIPYADGHAVAYTWLTNLSPTGVPSPFVVVEIRDGRTGELLHQDVTNSSPWSFGNFFTGDEDDGLLMATFGNYTVYGAGHQQTYGSLTAPMRTSQFITGPGGRKLLAGGVEGGVYAWDPSLLGSGQVFVSAIGGGNLMGGRNYLATDFDGDGTDEMVSLNFDDSGYFRMGSLLGGGAYGPSNAIHQLSVFTLS